MINLNKKTFKKNTILIKENDLSRKLFILRSGKVVVYKNHHGGRINLAVLGPGEIFGELSFFDAKKRSASVQAITDVNVDVIDGESLSEEIDQLPGWINLIFKSVAERFRKVDEKMTVLQSMVDFQNKNFSVDTMALNIYSELLRYIKIVNILNQGSETKAFDRQELITKLDEVTGKSIVAPKGFVRALLENEFFDHDQYHLKNKYRFNEKDLEKLELFLQEHIDRSNCYTLTNEAIAVFKKVLSSMDMMSLSIGGSRDVEISPDVLPSREEISLLKGYSELLKKNILHSKDGKVYVGTDVLLFDFKFHMVIKSFDRSSLLSH